MFATIKTFFDYNKGMLLEDFLEILRKELNLRNIAPSKELILVHNTHNLCFTDEQTVFVKVIGDLANTPKYLEKEYVASQSHSNTMEALTAPFEIQLPDNTTTFVSVWKYLSHEKRETSDLNYDDGTLIGRELKRFYSSKPLSPYSFEVSWKIASRPIILDGNVDTPLNVRFKYLALKERIIPNLIRARKENQAEYNVLCHGDPHLQNLLWIDKKPHLIDLESVKYETVHFDLACLYQSAVQFHNNIEVFTGIQDSLLGDSLFSNDLFYWYVQARNLSSTSFYSQYVNSNWEEIEENLAAIETSVNRKTLATHLNHLSQ